MKLKLSVAQKEAIDYVCEKERAMVVMPTGSGKTRVALEAVKRLGGTALVLAPASLKKNWEGALVKWDAPADKITIDTYSSFHKVDRLKKHKETGYDIIVLDEAHALKHYKTLATRALNSWIRRKHKGRVITLTATATVNRPSEMYWNLKFVNAIDINAEEYYKRYCGGFMIPGATYWKFGKPKHIPELRNKILSASYVPEPDKLGYKLPPVIKRHIVKEAPPINPSDLALREDYALFKYDLHKEEIGKLLSMYNKSLIFIHHNKVGEKLARDFNLPYIDGKTKNKQKAVEEYDKQESGHLIGGLKVLSEGFNINSVDAVIFLELGWNPATTTQAIGRATRYGRTRPLDAWFLRCKNEHTYKLQNSKEWLVELVHGPQHSKIGPSSFSRVEANPHSVYWKPRPVGEAAIRGTMLHEEAADYIEAKKVPKEMDPDIDTYVRDVKTTIKEADLYGVEEKVELFNIDEECYGTADFWASTGKNLYVVDLKTGRVKVKPENNTQLLYYALGVMFKYPQLKPDNVYLGIHQKGEFKLWKTTAAEVKAFEKRLHDVVKAVKLCKKDEFSVENALKMLND